MFRNKGQGRQRLANDSFDDDDISEGGGFLANSSPLNRDKDSEGSALGGFPSPVDLPPAVDDPSKAMMKAAQDLGSISGAGSLGIASHMQQVSVKTNKSGGEPKTFLTQPSGGFGDLSEQPKQLEKSRDQSSHFAPKENPFDSLAGGADPILKSQIESVYQLKATAEPMEIKTRRLHDHVSELYKSIQKVCDDFHIISADLSDMLPPNTDPAKNISHKVAAKHEEVHNMVGVAIPAKTMPRFEQSLLGDLDLMMLHFVQEQKKFRNFNELNKAFIGDEDDSKDSSALKEKKGTADLKEAAQASEEGLQRLILKEKDMLDAWFFKFLQFQMHFWSETGQQVMSLQKPTSTLAEQLKERKLDPSESKNILGEVEPDTIVSSPGWGTEDAPKKEGGGWFGGKKKDNETTSQHAWLAGMFRRRNVDFFQRNGGGFYDDEDDSTSNPSSRRGSATNSRRGSRDNSAGGNKLNPTELSAKIDAAIKPNSNPLKRISGMFGGGKKRGEDVFGSQNGLLGQSEDDRGGERRGSFPRPPEQGAFPRPDGAVGGKNMESISSGQVKKSGSGSNLFSAFQSKNGEKEGGEEWVDFMSGTTTEQVEFDANEM
mmetsp:Transcript_20551/g.41124  ORF Transcript_20551/g.41124 Transcript_20551/m.41124 type:complete len:600 (+) Transcript_20551:26-1825(+)